MYIYYVINHLHKKDAKGNDDSTDKKIENNEESIVPIKQDYNKRHENRKLPENNTNTINNHRLPEDNTNTVKNYRRQSHKNSFRNKV